MNCRPGDLAVVVRSSAGNEGLIVTCLSLHPAFSHRMLDGSLRSRPCWRVDRKLKGWAGDFSNYIPDAYLRPIRPGDISDEEVRDLYLPRVPEHA